VVRYKWAMAKLKNFTAIALVVISCAMAIAACGGSVHPLGLASGGSSLANAELQVSECMRSRGVPNFPDPSGNGSGFNLNGTGINPQSPAFVSAQQTCFKLLPGGGPFAPHRTAQAMAQTVQVSQCMRRHGVSGFPDPTLRPPPIANHNEYSVVDDRNGAVLAVPSTININSPGFKHAATACGFD
jgi:hypothetical protein